MNEPRSEDQEAVILGSIDRFLERDVAPYVQKLEHADEYPAEMVERMRALGLFGATIPAAYGGAGASPGLHARNGERHSPAGDSPPRLFQSPLVHASAAP